MVPAGGGVVPVFSETVRVGGGGAGLLTMNSLFGLLLAPPTISPTFSLN